MSTPSASVVPRKVRQDLADSVEDIGSALGLLRESINDTDSGNLGGGQMCASDALEILSTLETRFSQMAASLATWSNLEEF